MTSKTEQHNVWVFKQDGRIQCDETAKEIPLEVMREQLATVVGAERILNMEKRHIPTIRMCGVPAGSVNAYEITAEGWQLLSTGTPGPLGFCRWSSDLETTIKILQRGGGGGSEMPSPFGSARIPIFLVGMVAPEGVHFCMDGATHQLIHATPDGTRRVTRLVAAKEEVAAVLQETSGSRQRVMVAGYMGGGIEGGCAHLNCYYAGREVSPEELSTCFGR